MTESDDTATRKSILGHCSLETNAGAVAGVVVSVDFGGCGGSAGRNRKRLSAAGFDGADFHPHRVERGAAARLHLDGPGRVASPAALSADRLRTAGSRSARGTRALPLGLAHTSHRLGPS